MLIKKLSKRLTTIDRLLILKFYDAKSLGFYSLGNLAFAPLLMVCSASNSIMYPRFAEKYGETGDPRFLTRYMIIPVENLALVASILIGVIYIALPGFVKIFLPKYTQGVSAARILMFGLFFYAVAGMAGNMLLTINKQTLRLVIFVGSALLNFITSYIFIQLGYGIEGVAFGSFLGYFVFFLISNTIAMHYSKASLKTIFVLLLKVILPISYVAVLCSIISKLIGISFNINGFELVFRSIVAELLFFCLIFYHINAFIKKNADILKLILKEIRLGGKG